MPSVVHGTLRPEGSMVAVIMAGGSGTRFWPLSRAECPKQYLTLGGRNNSLIQNTATRIAPLTGEHGILVVTTESQKKLVVSQLPQAAVLFEPYPRNTAACVGFAAVHVLETAGDVPMIVLPADHIVQDEAAIRRLYQAAAELSTADEVLVTIGVQPSFPETGYGYIQQGEPFSAGALRAFKVQRFVEKPSREKAEEYLHSGEYFWNSGMFVFRPSVFLSAVKQFMPELAQALSKIRIALGRADNYAGISIIYDSLASISVDVGVMEKARNVVMFPGDSFRWSDIGSWAAWCDAVRENEADDRGNIQRGDTVLLRSQDSAVLGNKKIIVGIGLKDLIIVDTDDALLVCSRDAAQDVKQAVDLLKSKGRKELL